MKRPTALTSLVGILCWSAITVSMQAHAQDKSWQEGALHDVMSEAQLEEKKAKDLEERAAMERERKERRLRSVEQQIAKAKFRIEEYKARQTSAQNELDNLKVDLADMESRLQSIKAERDELDQSSQATVDYLEGHRKELNTKS